MKHDVAMGVGIFVLGGAIGTVLLLVGVGWPWTLIACVLLAVGIVRFFAPRRG